MKVLIVGSGGREHAIATAVAKSPKVDKIYCAPGNAGIGQVAECVNIGAMEFEKVVDFAKEKEFTFSGLGLVTDYSLPGQLIGHLVMGAQEVQQCAQELGISEEKSLLLQHMILSHHGEPEFGAAVRPMCAEAELLSEIDLIDSRMEIYAEALQDLPVGSFSNRIFALDKKIYRHG